MGYPGQPPGGTLGDTPGGTWGTPWGTPWGTLGGTPGGTPGGSPGDFLGDPEGDRPREPPKNPPRDHPQDSLGFSRPLILTAPPWGVGYVALTPLVLREKSFVNIVRSYRRANDTPPYYSQHPELEKASWKKTEDAQ